MTHSHKDFLSVLPADWEVVPLSQLGDISSGGTPSRAIASFWNGDIAWVTPGEVTKLETKWLTKTKEYISKIGLANSGAILLPSGSLLVTSRATIGEVALAAIPITTNQGFKNITPNRSTHSMYLYYLLKYISHEFIRLASGSTFLEISKSEFSSIQVPRPPLDEQRAIADILDTIDAAIQNAERVITKQKAIRAGLLQDLLTYGLDANGEPRDPFTHPEQFQELPLGLIPKEWCESDVDTEFDISSGFTLGSHRRPKNHPRPYLRVANVQRERITLDDVLELEASDTEMRDKKLEVDDLLIIEGHANPDEIGRCAIVTHESAGMTYQNHIFRLRAKQMLPRFALAWLNGSMSRDYWHRMSRTSSGLYTINRTMLRMMPVLAPPKDEQIEIAKTISIQDAVIDDAIAHHDKLVSKKKGLMDDLLTGRVRVSDVQMDEVMEQK